MTAASFGFKKPANVTRLAVEIGDTDTLEILAIAKVVGGISEEPLNSLDAFMRSGLLGNLEATRILFNLSALKVIDDEITASVPRQFKFTQSQGARIERVFDRAVSGIRDQRSQAILVQLGSVEIEDKSRVVETGKKLSAATDAPPYLHDACRILRCEVVDLPLLLILKRRNLRGLWVDVTPIALAILVIGGFWKQGRPLPSDVLGAPEDL